MNGLRRYAVAVGAVGLSTLCRWLVDGWLGDYLPFVTYFAAVALVGLYAGLGPAILSTIGGGLIGDYLFMPPRATLALNGSELWVGLTLFFIMSTVIISLTERIRRSRERRTRELEEANRQKDEFISMLAHELRNPLAAIRNAVEIVPLTDSLLSNDARFAIEIIEKQSAQLNHLVDEILDVARIVSGRISLTPEAVDLAKVAAECVDNVRSRCERSGIDLFACGLDEPTWVSGDRSRLIQVFANVLDNACKYTDEGGQISLVLERRGDRCIVKVADTGIGIDPVELDRLYEAFFQIEARADRQASGLGLGLHLVKRLVEKHGGIVRAQSEGLGRGAEFIIELPTIVAPGSDASECQRVDAPDGVKVLIIDDNIDAALSLRMLLDILGQRAEVAATGEEGLERAQAFRPDTVFVDLRMPGMDGFEVAHGLREQFGDEIRLIALTGLSRDQRKNQAQFSEFDDVIVKPASAQVVLQALGAVSA